MLFSTYHTLFFYRHCIWFKLVDENRLTGLEHVVMATKRYAQKIKKLETFDLLQL